jgi:hypothetical protein
MAMLRPQDELLIPSADQLSSRFTQINALNLDKTSVAWTA